MTHDNPLYLVYTTVEDAEQAQALARGLVDARLVACAQIHPPCESVFPWDGQVQTATEVALTLKTSRACWPSVKAWLAEHHPYEVPEALAVPVADGLPAYTAWAHAWLADDKGESTE